MADVDGANIQTVDWFSSFTNQAVRELCYWKLQVTQNTIIIDYPPIEFVVIWHQAQSCV